MSSRPNPRLLSLLQQGVSLHNVGRFGDAEPLYRAALQVDPRHPDALHLLGLCRLQLGDDVEAERLAREAIHVNSRVAMFHNTLGEALRRQGRLAEAETAYQAALRLDPGHLDAEANLSLIAEARGDKAGAARRALQVYRARSADRSVGMRALRLLAAAGEQELAQSCAEALLAPGGLPLDEAVFAAVVSAFAELRCMLQALGVAERWQQQYPESAPAALWRAKLLAVRHREAEAIPLFEAQLQRGEASFEALLGLAGALQRSGRPQEALAYFERARELAPEDYQVRRRRALLLLEEGRCDEAVQEFRALATAAPEEPQRRVELAVALLLSGDFAAGWAAYEARTEVVDCDSWVYGRRLPMPRWQGEAIAGKRLLLVAEQGAGDLIQFARFLPAVQALGAELSIETPAATRELLAGMAPGAQVFSRGAALPAADLWCPLMSLPQVLGRAGNVAAATPYLPVDPQAVARWRERLRATGAVRTVGVCWAGAAHHTEDPWRSCAPHLFDVLGVLPGVHFVCLQKERRAEGVPALPNWLDWTDELDSFADTAALVAALDAVVTVDTSVAHLAGALNVPAAVLLVRLPDWRWQIGREDSPWYPSLHLIRQTRHGHWPEALAAASRWLAARFELPAANAGDAGAGERVGRSVYVLCETRHGRMLANRNDRYVGRSLIDYGEFSADEVALISDFVVPDAVVIDAGANIGALTVPLARKAGPRGRVLAFEPQRLVFQMLCANLALNELFNVDARQLVLGAHPGSMPIADISPVVIENFGGVEAGEGSVAVPMTTIDALQLSRCDLIKGDVEGMELELLRGAALTIERLRPVLYLENDRRENSPALIGALLQAGYHLWWHTPPLFSEQNFRKQRTNVFGNVVSINLLCVPRERGMSCGLPPVAGVDDWYQR